jgi:hypothetical protein
MSRTALSISVMVVLAGLPGCTQDFGTFDPAGSGGGSPTATSTGTSPSTTTGDATSASTGGDGGAAASTGSGGVGGEAGGVPTTCDVPTDCDDDNPCTDDACVDSVCEYTALEDQVLVDSPDDCRTIACADGAYVDEPNDDEDPGDTNPPCEVTICERGEPTPVFADDTTECGNGEDQHCDGAGLCVGCDPGGPAGDECGAETDCASPVCEEPGVCDPGYLPANTVLDDEMDGNCQKPACTGDSAAPISVADDTDEPADLPCGNRACTGGAPTTVTVAEGMPCLVGDGVCDGAGTDMASCKACVDDAAGSAEDSGCDAATPVCDPAGSGTCVVCYLDGGTSVGCDAGATCNPAAAGGDGACTDGCVDDDDCTDQVCDIDTESCEDCASNGGDGADDGCGNALNPRCDEADRTCKGCSGAGDCTDNVRGVMCRGDNQCGCQNTGDCLGDLTCPGGGGVCE